VHVPVPRRVLGGPEEITEEGSRLGQVALLEPGERIGFERELADAGAKVVPDLVGDHIDVLRGIAVTAATTVGRDHARGYARCWDRGRRPGSEGGYGRGFDHGLSGVGHGQSFQFSEEKRVGTRDIQSSKKQTVTFIGQLFVTPSCGG
jgi:hypothetical protein